MHMIIRTRSITTIIMPDETVLTVSTKTPLMYKRDIILTIPHLVMISSKCDVALGMAVELM